MSEWELRCRQKTWPGHPLLPYGAYRLDRETEMREERQTTVQHQGSGERARVAGLQEAEVMGECCGGWGGGRSWNRFPRKWRLEET